MKCICGVFLYNFVQEKAMLQKNFVKDTLNCSPTFVRQFILSEKKKKIAEEFNKSLMIFLQLFPTFT